MTNNNEFFGFDYPSLPKIGDTYKNYANDEVVIDNVEEVLVFFTWSKDGNQDCALIKDFWKRFEKLTMTNNNENNSVKMPVVGRRYRKINMEVDHNEYEFIGIDESEILVFKYGDCGNGRTKKCKCCWQYFFEELPEQEEKPADPIITECRKFGYKPFEEFEEKCLHGKLIRKCPLCISKNKPKSIWKPLSKLDINDERAALISEDRFCYLDDLVNHQEELEKRIERLEQKDNSDNLFFKDLCDKKVGIFEQKEK